MGANLPLKLRRLAATIRDGRRILLRDASLCTEAADWIEQHTYGDVPLGDLVRQCEDDLLARARKTGAV